MKKKKTSLCIKDISHDSPPVYNKESLIDVVVVFTDDLFEWLKSFFVISCIYIWCVLDLVDLVIFLEFCIRYSEDVVTYYYIFFYFCVEWKVWVLHCDMSLWKYKISMISLIDSSLWYFVSVSAFWKRLETKMVNIWSRYLLAWWSKWNLNQLSEYNVYCGRKNKERRLPRHLRKAELPWWFYPMNWTTVVIFFRLFNSKCLTAHGDLFFRQRWGRRSLFSQHVILICNIMRLNNGRFFGTLLFGCCGPAHFAHHTHTLLLDMLGQPVIVCVSCSLLICRCFSALLFCFFFSFFFSCFFFFIFGSARRMIAVIMLFGSNVV